MIRYQPVNDVTTNSDRDGFVRAYQKAFAGPPYFENYSTEEVLKEVWYPHVQDGIVVLAFDDGVVVGFGCALPLSKAPADVRAFLDSRHEDGTFPVDGDKVWYMSELGVVETHRRRGIGYALVGHRLQMIDDQGDTHYVFRTAAEGSNSIHLYRRIGSTELADLQDVSASDQVQVNGSQSAARVFLFGSCQSALSELNRVA